jgi:hypothetical protein
MPTVFCRNQSFNALVLLLFHTLQNHRQQKPIAASVPYLDDCRKLLQVLLFCAVGDSIARCYLLVVEPYAVLFDLPGDPELCAMATELRRGCRHYKNNGINTTIGTVIPQLSIAELCESQLDRMSHYLLGVLRTPFGGDGRVQSGLAAATTQVEEDNHERFWTARGFQAEAWNQAQLWPVTPQPRKRASSAGLGIGGDAKKVRSDDIENLFKRTS